MFLHLGERHRVGPHHEENQKMGGRVKRRRKAEPLPKDDDSDVTMSSDDDSEKKPVPVQPSKEAKESVSEKRDRLAQELISKLSSSKPRRRDEEEDADEHDDRVNRALRKEVLQADGRLVRHLASNLASRFNSEPVMHSTYRSSHQHSVVSVALSQDETKCFSGSKEGNIVGWDLVQDAPFWKAGDGSHLLHLAVSSDSRYLATCGDVHSNSIRIYDLRDSSSSPAKVLPGHRDLVSSLVFRHNSHNLLSSSFDRSVRIWNVDEGSFIEELFGHTGKITSVDCLSRERCVTAGEDISVRLWKIPEESHLVLSGKHVGPIDCVKMVNESVFVSGSQEGTLALWGASSRRPTSVITNAHGPSQWINSVAAIRGSDVIASGSSDGLIRVWELNVDKLKINPNPIVSFPCVGHVNSLAFGSSGTLLVAGVGKEPKMGRWRVCKEAKNGVHVFKLPPSEEGEDDE